MSRFPSLSGFRDISHFITTRHGGVSSGTFASMNPSVYSADDPEAIQANLDVLSRSIGIPSGNIIMPHQIHKDKILYVDRTFLGLAKIEQKEILEGIDALVTDVPDICVAVSTADCVPVLFYAPDRKIVAAVHAGWRGTVQRIAQQTAYLLVRSFDCDPKKLMVGIGPSISQNAFEVGEEVVDSFVEADFSMEQILRRNPETGKAHIDLWEANRMQLLEVGLCPEHIDVLGICTYENYKDYFSARRLGVKSGRILSGIFLKS